MERKRFLLSLCLIVFFVLLQNPMPTAACSCAMMPSPEQGFSEAQAVFSGEVISIKDNSSLLGGYGKTVLFAVKETWKGTDGMEVAITTGSGGGDCGIAFVTGQDYLVYAHLSDMYEKQSLSTNICSPTKILADATKDLSVFGEGQIPSNNEVPIKSGKTTYLIIGGVVFIAGLFTIIGWMRYKKVKS
ncbi:hypothetical protein [Sporosarcina beigongshangi]|uniref:hypothetical protein n=1 Tax=Sporosarcina beigongshangi TaxID=2782538 RepID=UPI001939B1C7|nr:hypothetical protein [Sporosarcina beigongshangi]